MNCDKAPPGWRCTRLKGHEGPCAAEVEAFTPSGSWAENFLRWLHNRKRISKPQFLYAHNRADNTWSCTCHTVGDRIWGPIGKAEPLYSAEFGGYKRGDTVDPMRLLKMEGWTDVWLYTKGEWTLLLYKDTFGHDWKPKT